MGGVPAAMVRQDPADIRGYDVPKRPHCLRLRWSHKRGGRRKASSMPSALSHTTRFPEMSAWRSPPALLVSGCVAASFQR